MGNMNVTPNMITAPPETREAIAKGIVSAKDSVARHVKNIKDIAGTSDAKAIAAGAAVGAAAGAVSPIPGGTLIGAGIGAAAAAAANGVKKAAEQNSRAVKTALAVGLIAGPITGLTTYAFCSGKAQSAWEKMKKFVQEHPEALLATAGPVAKAIK